MVHLIRLDSMENKAFHYTLLHMTIINLIEGIIAQYLWRQSSEFISRSVQWDSLKVGIQKIGDDQVQQKMCITTICSFKSQHSSLYHYNRWGINHGSIGKAEVFAKSSTSSTTELPT